MAYKSRTVHLLAIGLITLFAVFAYDALVHSLWANGAVAFTMCLILVFLVWVGLGARSASSLEPVPVLPGTHQDVRILLDQVPIPLVRWSSAHNVTALNRAARALFQTDDLIVDGAEALVAAVELVVPDGRPVIRVYDRLYAISVSEITSNEGELWLATLTDVQMEMHKAEAAALRDTLHILSHEIMNSLTPVGSLAEIADSYLEIDGNPDIPAARESLEMLIRRTASLTRFIEAYRSVARLPPPVFQVVEPAALVGDIVSLFSRSARAQRVQFDFDVQTDLPRLRIDEAQVGQAIINVITNALEAFESVTGDLRIKIALSSAHMNVMIKISDTGSGVPEGIRDNLFSAFATTKVNGTGTGLNLARQIALAQGGNLQLVASDPDFTTTFAFTFPVHA